MTTPFLTSPLLELPGVRHAFFTRRGGVSTGIYESLNVGRGSADARRRPRDDRDPHCGGARSRSARTSASVGQ